jgi:6-pyruvoyl-tetrahydropterin synthase
VVDVAFMRSQLDENDIVVDIGRAQEVTKRTLAALNFRNLDEHPDFAGRRSTTEAVARWIFERIRDAITGGELGAAATAIERLRITLHESHVARASYDAEVGGA